MTTPSVDTLSGISVVSVSGTTSPVTNAITTAGTNELILVSMNSQYAAGSVLTASSVTGGGLTFSKIASRYIVGGGANGQFTDGNWLTLEVWGAWAPTALTSQAFTVNISQNTSVLLSAIAIKDAYSEIYWNDPNPSLPATGSNPLGRNTISYATTLPHDLVLMYTGTAGFTADDPSGTTRVLNWAGAGSIYIDEITETAPVSASATLGNASHSWGTVGIILAVTSDPTIKASSTTRANFQGNATKSLYLNRGNGGGGASRSAIWGSTIPRLFSRTIASPSYRASIEKNPNAKSPYSPVPTNLQNWYPWMQIMARTVNNCLAGKTNNTLAEFTLTPHATQTVLRMSQIGSASVIILSPLTTDAANEKHWFTEQQNGQVIVNHSNSASADRTYSVMVVA